MKSIYLQLALLSLIIVSSCKSGDDSDVEIRPSGTIGGSITTNTTYAQGDYTLSGALIVEPGATVIFDAGSVITCDKSDGVDFVLVKNGGKLIVNGTENSPVVFTEKSKTVGSWGGIIMYGDAPITSAGGLTQATSEDGNYLIYGGTNVNHNGGILRYVRVEYAGRKITDGTGEMNGFSFYSVGAGTILDHLVSYKGGDDGFEFFGGTVSATNLISYGNFDDAFDWQDGWQGQANSNWLGIQTGVGNFGMEIESSNNNNSFYPVIKNITLKRAEGCTPETAGDVQYDAFQFKKEGNGVFSNISILGFGATSEARLCRIQDLNTLNHQLNAGKIKLLEVYINDELSTIGSGNTSFTSVFPEGSYSSTTLINGASFPESPWANIDGLDVTK